MSCVLRELRNNLSKECVFMKTKVSVFAMIAACAVAMSAHADDLKVWGDGTAYVQGKVVDYKSGCEVDGVCSVVLEAKGQKVVLVYAGGDAACMNTQAVSWIHWGDNVKNGTVLKAYGAYTKLGDAYALVFCESKDYFILGEKDPLPDGEYTKKIME